MTSVSHFSGIVKQNTRSVIRKADLDGTSGFGGAFADVEESRAARRTLTVLAACPSQVDDQRLVLKQAHEVWRLLALSDTNLPTRDRSVWSPSWKLNPPPHNTAYFFCKQKNLFFFFLNEYIHQDPKLDPTYFFLFSKAQGMTN